MRVLGVFKNLAGKCVLDFDLIRPTATFSTHRQTSWAIGNDPPLYTHMPLPVFRSHTPGRRRFSKPHPRAPPPDPPVKARIRRFRGCNQSTPTYDFGTDVCLCAFVAMLLTPSL